MATPDATKPTIADTTNQSGMTLGALETAKFWSDIAAVSLAVLTAVAGVLALYFSARLSAAKDAELARFQTESKVAISSAEARSAEANEKAAAAEHGTAKALADAAEANKLAESFRLDIARANEGAAKANETAEKERLARLELERAVAPRHITNAQKETLRTVLGRQRAPSSSIKVAVFIGTEDGIPFSLELIEAIKAAGWPVEHTGQTTMGGHLRGVSIVVKDAKTAPSFALILQEALKQADLGGDGVIDASQPEGQITILIAPKR